MKRRGIEKNGEVIRERREKEKGGGREGTRGKIRETVMREHAQRRDKQFEVKNGERRVVRGWNGRE